MRYRKLKADRLFNGFDWLEENTVLVTDLQGTVQDVVPAAEAGDNVEVFRGILLPGFINCHCHVELSHMQGVVPPHTGLVPFLQAVVKKRAADEAVVEAAIVAAEKELYANGIAGVADICNTTHALATKQRSRLYWHNLVEVINLYDRNLHRQMLHYNSILQAYQPEGRPQAPGATSVLTPHAPYTISEATWHALNAATTGAVISVHNQESRAENELFRTGGGDFLQLYAALGLEAAPLAVSGKTSLQTYLPHFTNGQTILLVHNTFISEEDIVFARRHAQRYGLQLVYCLCPNANLFIENTLPPVDLLLEQGCTIVLGTDSYSSNWQLSIAAEIKALLQHFPHLPLATVLRWATASGAGALRWSDALGSFGKGKKPGVVLLDEASFTARRIV